MTLWPRTRPTLQRLPTLCLTLALGSWCATETARADVKIEVAFDEVLVEVMPVQRNFGSRQTRVFTLSGKNELSVSSSWNGHTQGILGHQGEHRDINGDVYKWTLRIVNGAFVIVNDYPGFVTVQKIKTDGKSHCTFSREYHKKPGKEYFDMISMSKGNHIYLSDWRAENISCSITQITN